MKLATWNINSIRARSERLLAWLDREKPDVLCLQETKVEDAGFPTDALRKAGYEVAMFGQTQLQRRRDRIDRSRSPTSSRGLATIEPTTKHALIAATTHGIRVVCVYVPNGQDLDVGSLPLQARVVRPAARVSRSHREARRTARRVRRHERHARRSRRVVARRSGPARSTAAPPERAALAERRRVSALVDLFRAHNPDGGVYSWWDYRGVSFFKNQGLRIDLIYVHGADRRRAAPRARSIATRARARTRSDHAPVDRRDRAALRERRDLADVRGPRAGAGTRRRPGDCAASVEHDERVRPCARRARDRRLTQRLIAVAVDATPQTSIVTPRIGVDRAAVSASAPNHAATRRAAGDQRRSAPRAA